MGGVSNEYEISILTGNEVAKALSNKNIILKKVIVKNNLKQIINEIETFNPDCIFNAMHGKFGEDGQIQAILNSLKIPYTHSGVLASSVAMDKKISKLIFEKIGIKCPKGIIINSKNSRINIKYPFILKPVDGGSSISVYKIDNNRQKSIVFDEYFRTYKFGLIEEYIDGRDLTVGVFNNKVCGLTEIVSDSNFYDYKNKYLKVAKHILNPKLPNKIKEKLFSYAMLAHDILNCNFISRSDFRYNQKSGDIYFLEINTQPGLTQKSLIPEMISEIGISFPTMCEQILKNSKCEK